MGHLELVKDEYEKEEKNEHENDNKQKKVKKEKKKWFSQKKLKDTKKNKQKQPTKKKIKILRQTADILPFLQIHDDYILLKDGVMDIFQVQTQNIHALNEAELDYLLVNRARFLRSYFRSYKEVILNFPANTDAQRAYWKKKKEQTTNSIRMQYIEQKLYEFDYLERERSNREFFLFIYADDKEELSNRTQDCFQGMQQTFPLKKVTRSKKEQILFLLNNQNTKL